MSIIVTGANGFIGRHLTRKLLETGQHVIAIDTVASEEYPLPFHSGAFTTYYFENEVDWSDDAQYPTRMRELVSNILHQHRDVTAIVHLGGVSHLPYVADDPVNGCITNVLIPVEIMQAVAEYSKAPNPVVRIILAGSGEEYGAGMAVLPSAQLQPYNMYAATKAAMSMMAEGFIQAGLDILIARFATVYGPDQTKEKFIPRAIARLHRNLTIELHENGGAMRDWAYIDDVISALETMLGWDAGTTMGGPRVVHVTGDRRSVANAAEIIQYMLRQFVPNKPMGELRLVDGGSLSRTIFMRDDPRVRHNRMTSLETGIRQCVVRYLSSLKKDT